MNRITFFLGNLLVITTCVFSAEPPPDPLAAEREAVWNSPDMLAARGWLIQYFAASKRHSARNAQQYLERLHASSPQQMRDWLADFHLRRVRQHVEQQQAGAQRQWALNNNFAAQRQQQLAAQQAATAAQARVLQAQLAAQQATAAHPIPPRPGLLPYDDVRLYGFPSRTLAILNFLDTQAIREELQQRNEK